MRFEVCFLPSEATRQPPPVAVLIDVIRASTTVVTMLERGCREILLARHADRDRIAALRDRFAPALVCGEDPRGLQLADADLGPSPAALGDRDLKGQRVILCTANGTRAAELLEETGVEHVLVGCMRNAPAVMDAAVRLAARLDRSVSLVCAGREACRIPALDDVCCAAALLTYGEGVARTLGREPVVMESGRIARAARAAFPSIRDAFDASATAEVLRRVDSVADVAFCAEEAASAVVPVLTFRTRAGLTSIGPYEERP
ncbi:MAG: 2-phosphosulfolactate phosphatase [Candidatus Rokuibacteriota bacterium]